MYAKLAFRNMRRSVRDYGIYFATLVIGVCMFYAFNSVQRQTVVLGLGGQDGALELISTLIGGVSVFLAIILGFLVVYANRFLIQRRKKEFAIYLTLGMERGQVSRIMVMETLLVGLVSLAVGLLLGYLLSQLLLVVTAAMFSVHIDAFSFFFSGEAAGVTIACFAVMFLVAMVFNVATVSRYKLIDLLYADRKSEKLALHSLPLSIALMAVAVACIGVAYWLLTDTGLNEIDPEFIASAVLVCVGTFLFFYSLSGVLLRVAQGSRKHYLSGLNMFTMRQLNNRVNTAWVSVSLVCLLLFLALTSTCGGFSIAQTFNKAVDKATFYDATYTQYFDYAENSTEVVQRNQDAAAVDGYDMEAAFSRDVPGWDNLVESTAQVTVYEGDVDYSPFVDVAGSKLPDVLDESDFSAPPIAVVPLSELNVLRALHGLDPVSLGQDEFLIWYDYDQVSDMWEYYASQNPGGTLELYSKTMKLADTAIDTTSMCTSAISMNLGTIVVPDSAIPEGTNVTETLLNVMYNGSRDQVDPEFQEAVASVYDERMNTTDNTVTTWPASSGVTATEMLEQSVSLSVLVSYLAIYIGIILLITCAAILALQQLSESADNISRYALIRKLGAPREMVRKALYQQIGVYFIFPLVVALCHSAVAMAAVSSVVQLLGQLEIVAPLAITTGLAVLVYGGYYLITCSISRNMVMGRR